MKSLIKTINTNFFRIKIAQFISRLVFTKTKEGENNSGSHCSYPVFREVF